MENFDFINQLLENGNLIPVVDKTFPFEKLVDAHRYVESGYKIGNVAITVNQNNKSQS